MMSADLFAATFGDSPRVTQFTPGRVNILGEHTDYNGGTVLPMALDIGVSVSLSPRTDETFRVASKDFVGVVERGLDTKADGHWSDYVVGAVVAANRAGLGSGGADVALSSTLPHGSGLSSSAAVCVGTLKALRAVNGADMDDTEIAVLARAVENDFIGVPCGIMDQMAVAVTEPGDVLALDTRSLDYERIALRNNHHIAVVHSGVVRKLNEGRYAERKRECDRAKGRLGTDDLCHITDDQLASLRDVSETVFRRARHCVTEEARTTAAVEALRGSDMTKLGHLMNAGHASIRDDFEITTPAVDALVADAVELGALGARQTGGGFGGCIVALVPDDRKAAWFDALRARHPAIRWVA